MKKGLAGAGVHEADINTAQAPTGRARTAELRGSLPDSSTAGSLMSAVWTPGRSRNRGQGLRGRS